MTIRVLSSDGANPKWPISASLAVVLLSAAAILIQHYSIVPFWRANSPLGISTVTVLILGALACSIIAWCERRLRFPLLAWSSGSVGMLALAIGEATGSFIRVGQFWDDDYRYKLPFWIAAGIGVYIARRSGGMSRHAFRLLRIGFVLQGISNLLDMGDGDLFKLPFLSLRALDFATEISELVFAQIYVAGLVAALVANAGIATAATSGLSAAGTAGRMTARLFASSRIARFVGGAYYAEPGRGLHGKYLPRHRVFGLEAILSQAEKRSVLDLGCAEGLIAEAFLNAGASRLDAFDIRPDRIAAARRLVVDPRARFNVGDVSKWMALRNVSSLLPEYDIVLFLGLYQYLPGDDRAKILGNVAMMCRRWFALRAPREVIEEATNVLRAAGLRLIEEFAGSGVGRLRLFERTSNSQVRREAAGWENQHSHGNDSLRASDCR